MLEQCLEHQQQYSLTVGYYPFLSSPTDHFAWIINYCSYVFVLSPLLECELLEGKDNAYCHNNDREVLLSDFNGPHIAISCRFCKKTSEIYRCPPLCPHRACAYLNNYTQHMILTLSDYVSSFPSILFPYSEENRYCFKFTNKSCIYLMCMMWYFDLYIYMLEQLLQSR